MWAQNMYFHMTNSQQCPILAFQYNKRDETWQSLGKGRWIIMVAVFQSIGGRWVPWSIVGRYNPWLPSTLQMLHKVGETVSELVSATLSRWVRNKERGKSTCRGVSTTCRMLLRLVLGVCPPRPAAGSWPPPTTSLEPTTATRDPTHSLYSPEISLSIMN